MKKHWKFLTTTAIVFVSALGFIQPISAAVTTFVGRGLATFDSIFVKGSAVINGTISNNTTKKGVNNPVVIGDNLRVDGDIFRKEIGGTNTLKFADTLRPSTDAVYSLGEAAFRFQNLYLSGNLLGTGIVGTTALADSVVTAAKIADGVITGAKLADGTITSAKIADSIITSAKITDGTISTADLADSSVTTAKITDGTVANADLVADAVTADKIVDASNAAGLRKADLGVLSTTVTVDPPNIPANTCAYVTAAAVGTLTSDLVVANMNQSMTTGLIATAYDVDLADTINFQFCNVTTGALDGAARLWRILVLR